MARGVPADSMSTRIDGNPPRAAIVLLGPFQRFFALEVSGSLLLLGCAIFALIAANSPFADDWFHLWEIPVAFGVGEFQISNTLHHWINDGLMAIFFFVVGLEIKREVLVGELASARRAALPIAGAVGGMVVPALIYAAFNAGTDAVGGWGIPMATDIAFALGVLALLGKRAPLSLKVFLTALAIIDDLGAVLVIAVFYTSDLSPAMLALAAIFLAGMFALNLLRVRFPLAYLVLGIGLWLALLQSGVHATIAGILAALTIPVRRKIAVPEFTHRVHDYLREVEEDMKPGLADLTSDQRAAIHSLEQACEAVDTPLNRLEHELHPYVVFLIVPIFALANAGVSLDAGIGGVLTSPIALGIILGLVLGKQVGVMLFAWLAVRMRLADLPADTTWRELYGVAWLCGIGFTMSLFIGNLALATPEMLDTAKAGILAASLLSGVGGWLVLARVKRKGER
jgi:NhaA family Na+:H+ antiporter